MKMEIAVFTASEAFMSHANARLTVHGRLLLVQRVAAGRPVALVARELGGRAQFRVQAASR
jgi:L-lactate utilization protein LutC